MYKFKVGNKVKINMQDINKLEPQKAIVFEKNNNELVLIQGRTKVKIITDDTDFNHEYSGLIIFLSTDGLTINDSEIIKWNYIKEIIVLN